MEQSRHTPEQVRRSLRGRAARIGYSAAVFSPASAARRLKIKLDVLRNVRPGIECPICGNRLWFWRIPRNQGSYEIQCQGCGTMQRQRRTILFLRQTGLGDSVSPVRVLHVAPDARIQAELQNMPNVETVTGDLLTGDVDITLDITAMDLPDESFDVIICSHVLEHVLDDRAAMSEMRRVLKSDGWALINVPSDPNRTVSYEDATITSAEDRLAAFGQEDHVRIYSHGDLLQRFADAGFDVQVDPLLVSTEERRRYVLSGDGSWEHGYLCKKSNRTAAPAD